MNESDPVVITGIGRTPMGDFQGSLSAVPAPELGTVAIRAALEDGGIEPDDVDEVLMGCVLMAGMGQAPARQASLGAEIPNSAGCTTVNKMCGSGMKTAMIGTDSLYAGTNDVVVAGGMESMTNAPYLLDRAREGYRLGHGKVADHMFLDGLEDAYDKGRLMGTYAEDTAQYFQFTREAQDAYAITSLTRARTATDDGTFAREITPIMVKTRRGENFVEFDAVPGPANIEKIPKLRPAFAKDGTVTAANSSTISDGAAAMVLMRRSEAEKRGVKPRAIVHQHATHSQEPAWYTTAPIGAIKQLLEKTGWKSKDVDLYEVNEAFAVVPMGVMRELGITHDILNVHGGACALGHPIGATGARIVVTLLTALEKYDLTRGIATCCIGGGEATGMAIERIR